MCIREVARPKLPRFINLNCLRRDQELAHGALLDVAFKIFELLELHLTAVDTGWRLTLQLLKTALASTAATATALGSTAATATRA